MNNQCHGVSMCWAFFSNEKEATVARVLRALQTALAELEPEFTCSAFVKDDCAAEQNAAR
jgi:hypothetical protein